MTQSDTLTILIVVMVLFLAFVSFATGHIVGFNAALRKVYNTKEAPHHDPE